MNLANHARVLLPLLLLVSVQPVASQERRLQGMLADLGGGAYGTQFWLTNSTAGGSFVLTSQVPSPATPWYVSVTDASTGRVVAERFHDAGRAFTLRASDLPRATLLINVVGPAPAAFEASLTPLVGIRAVQYADPPGDAARSHSSLPSGYAAPDIVHATASVFNEDLVLQVEFVPDTWDRSATAVWVCLDMDEDESTGAATTGCDYGARFEEGRLTVVQLHRDGRQSIRSGLVRHEPLSAGVMLAIPLEVLGGDDGQLRFWVGSQVTLGNGATTGAVDIAPGAAFLGGGEWISLR